MSEYQQYYDTFTDRLRRPEGLTEDQCRCNGGGWILSDVDTWHHCPDHFKGQAHPDEGEYSCYDAPENLLPMADLTRLAPEEVYGTDDIPF